MGLQENFRGWKEGRVSMTEEIIRVEWKSSGKTNFTDMKLEGGRWWKLNKKQQWVQCLGTDDRRRDKFIAEKSMASLFDQPKFKELEAKVAELNALVSPASAEKGQEPLHDDITNETIILPIMYREDILGPLPKYRTLQRHHVGDSRYYVQQFQDDDGNWSKPSLYAGVTSVCGAVLPEEGDHLRQWYCSFASYEEARKELNKLAARGTVMHSLFAMCMDDKLPDFGTADFDRLLRQLISGQEMNVNEVFGEWKSFMCKALLGFKQFMYDHSVEPLAVEIVLGQPDKVFDDGSKINYGYFAQIDLLCYMEVEMKGEWGEFYKSGPKKDKPKITKKKVRILAIVDFKSGSGNYVEHIMQLHLQMPLVRRAFPHLDSKDMRVFNWHPKEFRTSALATKFEAAEDEESDATLDDVEFGYTLIDQTDKKPKRWAMDHLHIWQKYHAEKLPRKMVYKGSPNIGTPPAENVEFKDYPTFWEEKVARSMEHRFADL